MELEPPEHYPEYGEEPEEYTGVDAFRYWLKENYGEGYCSDADCGGRTASWKSCRDALGEGAEEAEVLLDHETGTAHVMTGADADELEEDYGTPRYQVMGRRRPVAEEGEEEEEWEPVRDISGPSWKEEMAANVVAAGGATGFRTAEAGARAVFEGMSALARFLSR